MMLGAPVREILESEGRVISLRAYVVLPSTAGTIGLSESENRMKRISELSGGAEDTAFRSWPDKFTV